MGYQTEQRKRLYALLRAHPHTRFSAREIYEALSDGSISISAVYRNLATMTKEGQICKSTREGSHEALYQYLQEDGCRNQLHLTCVGCGRVLHMNRQSAQAMQESVACMDGFVIDSARTVLYGTCMDCDHRAKPGTCKAHTDDEEVFP
ncbi:MAG TPA: hypothetical protein DIT49_06820 [Clostridiales bacterium]|nr:hypothetical protein [Clostridiales bacterium]